MAGDAGATRRPWADPGWAAEAGAWLATEMERLGRPLTGPPEEVQAWELACVLRAPTTAGDVYLKANAPSPAFVNEGVVMATLARLFGDLVPAPLAVEAARGRAAAAGRPPPGPVDRLVAAAGAGRARRRRGVTDGTSALCRAAQPGPPPPQETEGGCKFGKVGEMELETTGTELPELIACPEIGCGVPAGVVDRFVLASTGGPVEHVKTWCLDGHGFTQRVDALVAWPMIRLPRPLGAGG